MKTALITGSSAGIGKAIAINLAQNGFQVFLTGRNESALKTLASQIGALGFLALDLLENNASDTLIKAVHEKVGTLDILVNNAGVYEWGTLDQFNINENKQKIQTSFKLNSQLPLELSALVLPHMKKQKWGRIINIGSISGLVGEPNAALYSASKASLIGLTKALALEVAEHGITVNLINPGWVKTNLVETQIEAGNLNADDELAFVPQKRWIEPSEIAAMVSFLCGPQAMSITGQSINICAGLSLG